MSGTYHVDNYAPTGLSGASVVRISSNNDLSITGMDATTVTPSVVLKELCNVGVYSLTLTHQDTRSTVYNRFTIPGAVSYVLPPAGIVLVYYDVVSATWRVQPTGSGSGGTSSFTVITPADITYDINNYTTTDFSAANVIRFSSDMLHSITGFDAATAPTTLLKKIYNIGTNPIVLVHLSTASSAGNRLSCPGATDIILQGGDVIDIFYDVVSTVWRLG